MCFGSLVFIPFSPTSPSGLNFYTWGPHTISRLESLPALPCSYSDSLVPSAEKCHSFPSLCLHSGCAYGGGVFFTLLRSPFHEFQNLTQPLSSNINIPSSEKTSPKFPRSILWYLIPRIPLEPLCTSNGAHAVKCLVHCAFLEGTTES